MSKTFETLRRQSARRRWWGLATTIVVLVSFAVVFAAASGANLTGSTFESTDGNLIVDGGAGATDWANVAGLRTQIDQPTGATDNAFGQGTAEDDTNVTVVDGSIPPNKNDLTRSYLASETVGSQTFLYLAWERLINTGSANIDFELDQNATAGWSGTTTGAVTINRTEGDLLFTYDFSGSGNPTLGLNTWLTSGHGHTDNDCVKSGQTLPCWGNHITLTSQGTPSADGAVNTADVVDSVTSPAVGTLTAGLFGEAAINLSAIPGLFTPDTCKAFGTEFVKSRASGSSIDAELKDFIAPSPIHVTNCGSIELKKQWVGAAGSTTLQIGTTAGASDTASQLVSGADGTTGQKVVENGNYFVSESLTNASDYTTTLSCKDNGGTSFDPGTGAIPVSAGHDVVCTYVNSRKPHLTLVKQVTNNNGGTATASQWTLSATSGNDPNNFSGVGPSQDHNVTAGVAYTLAESGGPSGYTGSAWLCNGGSQNGSSITLSAGQNVTCTITNDDNTPALHLRKTVTNDNGGTALPTAWTLNATGGPTPLSGTTPVDSNASFSAGTYTLSETNGPSGYTAGAWSCTGGNQNGSQITIGLGQDVTCTINNNDNAPALHLRKTVTNDNGGTQAATAWTLTATGTGGSPTNLSGTTPVDSNASFKADTYTLGETGPSGYTAGAWSCTGGSQNGNSIAVGVGQDVTCTINNNDTPPALHLRKTVVNDNGGTAAATDWTLTATGTGGSPTNLSGTTPVDSGATFKADTYALEENGPSGYTATAWSCVLTGTQTPVTVTNAHVTVGLGQDVTCTITNNDNGPALHLRKTVTNDNGGTAAATDWTLTATGTGGSPTNLSGATPVDSNASFKADTYTLAESNGPPGYTGGSWSCVLTGTQTPVTVTSSTVAVGLGQDVTCTITNNDNAPALHLRKTVTNDNGGTALATAWTLTASGPTPLSGSTPVDSGASFDAGTYTLAESGGPSGYTAGDWVCTGGGNQNGNSITVGLGEDVTCTINNNDNAPALHLRKTVTNDNGGAAAATDWTLHADGAGNSPTNLSGSTPVDSGVSFKADTYALSESGGPSAYTASSWSCVVTGTQTPVTVTNAHVTVGLGQDVTCTINNNDNRPSLHLVKTVTNDNGGTAVATDWTLHAVGTGNTPTNLSGTTPVSSDASFKADTYTLSESDGPSDYTASDWSCVLTGTQTPVTVTTEHVTVGLGQDVTCTIINNDNGPALHLRKTVTNDDGGTALATAWTLTATKSGAQSPTLSGSTPVDSGPSFESGTYTLDENGGPSDYTASNWTCVLTGTETSVPVTEGSVHVGLGQDVTCTIVNDDNAPTITVEKRVLPSTDKGTFKFTLTQGETKTVLDNGTDGYGNGDSTGQVDVTAGDIAIDEAGNGTTDGSLYSSSWSCSSNRERSASGNGTSISLGGLQLGENVTCTFTNTHLATLVVKKVVDNSNGGGSKTPADFMLHVTTGGLDVTGSPAAGSSTGTTYVLLPGTYKVSEGSVSGYSLTKIDGCLADGSIVLEAGQTATCTLTNTSAAPPPPPPPPPPTPRIDLQITKSAAPNPVTVGNGVTWTMVVTNNGPNMAHGVTVADPVPAGMTFVSATSSQGTCTGGALVNCTIGTMNVGSSVTITLVTTAAATGTITNTATTVGTEQETNTANNTASANVVVNGKFTPPVVYCTAVSVSPKQLFVGRKNTLTMKLTSHGKAKAGVKVKIKGSTLNVTTKSSNGKGIVKQAVRPMKAGIVVFQPVATKSCKNPRIGVIGVFTPPVTG